MGEGSLVFVKAGGSFITHKDKPFRVDVSALSSLASIIYTALRHGVRILLGHGGGSFAHPVVSRYRGCSERVEALVECQKATRLLNMIVVNTLIRRGVPAVQMQTSAIILSSSRGARASIEPVETAIRKGLVPVVYGECVLDEDEGLYRVFSTEEVFKTLIKGGLRPERIVYLERVAGVYDKDPVTHGDARLIRVIDRRTMGFIEGLVGGSSGIDVTGGMRAKVMLSLEVAREHGVPSIIVSGFDMESSIKAIVEGVAPRGTVISW